MTLGAIVKSGSECAVQFVSALFLIRDDSFLATVPDEYKTVFIDENPVAPEKLKVLKQMIEDRFPVSILVIFKVVLDFWEYVHILSKYSISWKHVWDIVPLILLITFRILLFSENTDYKVQMWLR